MTPESLKLVYRRAAYLLLCLFFSFSLCFFLFHLFFARKIIPGVTVYGVGNLSGLSSSQALEKTGVALQSALEKEVNFDFVVTKKTLRPVDLGLSFNIPNTVFQAYNVGRSGKILVDLQEELKSLIYGRKVYPAYTLDESVWEEKLGSLYLSLAGRDAQFVYSGQLYIEPGRNGLKVGFSELNKFILDALLRQEENPILVLPTYAPQITESQLTPLYKKVSQLIYGRPSVYLGKAETKMTESEFLKLLDFKSASVSASKTSVAQFVEEVSAKYNRPAKSVSFEVEGNKLTKFTPGEDGLEVDKDALTRNVARELLACRLAKILVPTRRISAAISGNKYGIKELIGRGQSAFAGSIPGRITNIKIATSRVSGTLVPPDGNFSFSDAVGEISAENGYDYAYIISEGRTVLGTGGGVCQVSTTVFRAALDAGLPIVTRTAHAYRVHYYEEGGSPVGLDATVYPPTVDLKFKNDTPGYILITSQIDLEGQNLYFNIYGTSDGRTVKLTGPKISNYTPAPEAKYQDDPTLEKGITKQVDWSAPGSTVIFERVVERGGQVVNTDKFISNYRPWQAVYLVGTKE